MIPVKRLNDQEIYLNPHLIETIEATPDTVITMTNGKRLVVKDSISKIVENIIRYRKTIADTHFTEHDGTI